MDGALVAERTDAPVSLTNSVADVGIGIQLISPTISSLLFNGLIDEIAIYDRALSLEEIQTIYNYTGAPIPEPSTFLLLVCGFMGILAFGYHHKRNRDDQALM